MKICIRKKDNKVILIGDDIESSSNAIKTNDIVSYEYNTENTYIVEIEGQLPDNFISGYFTYIDGVFSPTEDYQIRIEDINNKESKRIEEELKQQKQAEILALEAQITPRRWREALLGDTSFIDGIEKQINELRKELK